MIKTPHPLKLGGLAIAAVILVVLLLGTESWPMRVALLAALGAVGALTAVDLPFPQYHFCLGPICHGVWNGSSQLCDRRIQA